MKRATYLLALACLAPAAGYAQAPATVGPAARVLGHRAELSLTAAQVQQLEAIDRKYDRQDQEAVQQLEAARGAPLGQPLRVRDMAAADRERLLANRERIQPLMQQLRSSHQAARAEVLGVLTAEQNSKAGEYLYQGPGQGQGRGPAALQRGQGMGRGAGMGRAGVRGRGGRFGAGRGMMLHAPGTAAGFRGGRGGRVVW